MLLYIIITYIYFHGGTKKNSKKKLKKIRRFQRKDSETAHFVEICCLVFNHSLNLERLRNINQSNGIKSCAKV
jgi:2-iminoacetate synthase ThiH